MLGCRLRVLGQGGQSTVFLAHDPQLQREVAQAANALEELGIEAGDRVVVYLPVLVETIVITLACARIGAVHSLVFGGFSAEALRFRVEDTGAKLLVTTDGQFRRGTAVPVKANADEAVSGDNAIEHVLVLDRTGHRDIPWTEGRDLWWHDVVDRQPDTHTPRAFDAEHPLFIMYTSGTTGQPKGLVHTSGGYLAAASWTHDFLFSHPDPARRDDDVHWCTADLAWVTAHTYEIYGPLSNGVTQVIYEGVPNAPHPGRHFEVIERYRVTSYYTAPTLIRSLKGWHPDGIPAHADGGPDLSSIRLIGTVGEAVNPEAWTWARTQIGRDTPDLPMVDTWWQSETGATVLSPRPTDTAFKPGCGSRPLPGVDVAVVDDDGAPTPEGLQGRIVVTRTSPSMARTVWRNPARYFHSYWEDYADQGEAGWFLAGDGAKRDEDGDVWILGRVDDVINISGHRLSTIEIESALVAHPEVIEAGVCPVPHETTEDLNERWWGEASRRFSEETENRLVVALSDADLDLEATSTARSRLNLANVLDTASQRNIPVLVVGPTPTLDEQRNARLAELNAAYLDVADRRNHVYVDTFTPLVGHEQWRSDLASGQGRPGQAGHGLIAWLVLHRGWYQWLGLPEPTA